MGHFHYQHWAAVNILSALTAMFLAQGAERLFRWIAVCARLSTARTTVLERGGWWAVVNTVHNVESGALIPWRSGGRRVRRRV